MIKAENIFPGDLLSCASVRNSDELWWMWLCIERGRKGIKFKKLSGSRTSSPYGIYRFKDGWDDYGRACKYTLQKAT